MGVLRDLSRREFISTAAAATAATALPDFARAANTGSSTLDPDWKNAGVIATRNSPYAKLKSVPVQAVTIETGFWSKRRTINADSSIPSMRQQLLEQNRADNFLRLQGKSQVPPKGPVFSETDIYKWIEAAAFAMQTQPLPDLRSQTDAM